MRQVLWVYLWVLLPLQALGANLVLPTEPAMIDLPDVKFYSLAYGFYEAGSERFQLQVNLSYRSWTSHLERVKHLIFRLTSGAIAKRDDRTLVLRLDNREVVVGRHCWWYAPAWQTAQDVQIVCNRFRGLRRLVLKNCRLIVGNAPEP